MDKIYAWIAKWVPKRIVAHCIKRAWELAADRYEALDVDDLDWHEVIEFLEEK